MKAKVITIGVSLVLIFTGLVVWADSTMVNLGHKINRPKSTTNPNSDLPHESSPSSQPLNLEQ